MPPRKVSSTPSLFSVAPEPSADSVRREASPGLRAEWIQAHCDGGARGNPGPAGYGAVLEDERGAVIAELSEFLGMRTNNYAEYSGLLGCLQYALDHGHRRLKVVSDSELMVKQIQGKYQVKSPDLKPLYEEAKRRIARLDGFAIAHALRHKNKAADRLANEAMDRGTKRAGSAGMVGPIAATVKAEVSRASRAEAAPIPISFGDRAAVREQAVLASVGGSTEKPDVMLRGFTRDGVVHILGAATLPDGVFVKIIRE